MRLFYGGPALDALAKDYAMAGKVDARAPIQARATVEITASASAVWKLVADPESWPTFYDGVRDVQMLGALKPGTQFRRTMGKAKVRAWLAVVQPDTEISWVGQAMGSRVVHRNLIDSTGKTSCRLRNEESMAGYFVPLVYSSSKLQRELDGWLAAVKQAAERHKDDS
jgi:hypothetical protein